MKTSKISLCATLIVFLIGLSIAGKGQSLTVNCGLPNNTCSYALPNNTEHTYSVVMSSFAKCDNGKNCKYKWEVTNGFIVGIPAANPSILEANSQIEIKVVWNNVNSNGTIKVTSDKPNAGIAECSQCPIGLTQTKTIPIRYLGTPGNIKINGVAQSGSYQVNCGTAPINVAVDPVTNTKPIINSPDILLCNPKTITATASNATSYNWVATGGITANSPGNTNSAQITGVSDGTVKV